MEMAAWIVAVRRRLHRTPELMYDLTETAGIVREVLDELGIPYKYPIASHGIVATIGSGKQPVIALRSDMDALPVNEVALDGTDDFVSQRPGKMHACGHDAHMAMLLGAAKLLKARDKALTGTVQLVFQPAEEGGAGGLAMLLEGVSDSTDKVKRMFGMHVWPWLPTGSFGMKSGPIMAGAGTFEVVIKGKGGHAAAGIGMGVVDPTVAAAAAISSLQSIVARDVAPDDQAVISVTMIHGGNAYNVVPDQVWWRLPSAGPELLAAPDCLLDTPFAPCPRLHVANQSCVACAGYLWRDAARILAKDVRSHREAQQARDPTRCCRPRLRGRPLLHKLRPRLPQDDRPPGCLRVRLHVSSRRQR
jgi:metal-dependent amidase/aminoacylase/carboxypeptidase family protein